MEAWKAACVLVFTLCVVADGGCSKTAQNSKLHSEIRTIQEGQPKPDADCGQICYEDWEKIVCCPVGYICCTPGSPTSLCCAEDHPICVESGCCPRGYPQQCGDQYCCTSDSYCCNGENCCESEGLCCGDQCCTESASYCCDDKHCCENESLCCGDQCCQEQAPCCAGPDDEKTCCDEDEMACCGSTIGCVDQCSCPFDAIGCEAVPPLDMEDFTADLTTAGFDCPNPLTTNTLYRILREDEDCNVGLIAKDPSKERTVNSHVLCGGRINYESQYISTTSSVEVANYYKNKFSPSARIAIIKMPGNCGIYDLTTEENREKYLKGFRSKAYAKASCEVVLSCGKGRVPCTYASTDNTQSTRDTSEL